MPLQNMSMAAFFFNNDRFSEKLIITSKKL